MRLSFRLNGKQVETDVRPDMLLLDLVRDLGCYSVKRGCETANCGLCTVWLDGKPVLSCSTLAIRADGRHVTTLEGLQKEAEEFGMFLAREGGEQCGFCNPGFIMNVLAMEKELSSLTGTIEEDTTKEPIAVNIGDLLDELISQSVQNIGKPVTLMTKEDKVQVVRLLNEAGAFLITKSGPKVCQFLGISKYTLYSYLDEIKSKNTI